MAVGDPVESAGSFCTACGRDFDSTGCAVAHDVTAASHGDGIGKVVTYRRAFRRRLAVVVRLTEDGPVLVEDRNGTEWTRSNTIAASDWDWLSGVDSPLYRLEVLAARPQWHEHLSPWVAQNREDLLATIGDRRAFALAAIGGGDVELARSSGLPSSEITWLTMHVQRRAGDTVGAFNNALDLAPDSYPDHALVLLEAISAKRDLLDSSALKEHVRDLNPAFAGSAILSALADDLAPQDFSNAAAELDRLAGTRTSASIRRLDAGRDSRSTNVWTRALTMKALSVTDIELIFDEWPTIADDLIDAGVLDGISPDGVASPYVRARMGDPRGVSTDELRSFGALQELARRAYLSDDRSMLDMLADESSTDVDYYRVLSALRRGEVPENIPEDDVLKAVAASIRSGRAHPNALVDLSVWPVLAGLITADDAANHPEQAAVWWLEQSLDDVSAWRFESALNHARMALRWSDDEAIRDEALNVMGFVLYQQGRDEEAIAALEKALEGRYSANLQANIGIIAEDLQPEIAAHHLTRLAGDAPTIDLQLAAIRHAFSIWASGTEAWEADDLVVPSELLSVLRALVVDVIPYDDYVHLMQLLSRADSDWLAEEANTQSGPHTDTDAREVFIGRASHDPEEYVKALAAVSKRGNEDEWFVQQKASFVESLRSLIFADDASIGPAAYAFAAINAGLQLEDFDYVTLACGAAISILSAIAEDDGLPSDKVTAMIENARKRSRFLDEDQQELVAPLVSMVGNRYAIVVAGFHAQVHDEIAEAIRSMAIQFYGVPRRRINWFMLEKTLQPMQSQAYESAKEVKGAAEFVIDEELRERLRELESALESLRSRLSNPRGLF